LSDDRFLVHSVKLPPDKSGELLRFPREKAQWEWMSFVVHRLQPGEILRTKTASEEAAFVILGGTCIADWGQGPRRIGKRKNVFDGFPYTLYLPAKQAATFAADSTCEIAECRVPTKATHEPALIEPKDVSTNLRGGANASRQIVDVITPAFPADKLMVIEVYTPGGNWSSFPPHKHDVHNPPSEVDLDEIYYFRFQNDESFALQHLYGNDEVGSRTLKARDGDTVLVRSGYHTVVAGPGYDTYYLNFLAGSARSLAVTEDPEHSWIRSTWNGTDPRLPLIQK
jgi:5-deoxy-glucuronate isomerase